MPENGGKAERRKGGRQEVVKAISTLSFVACWHREFAELKLGSLEGYIQGQLEKYRKGAWYLPPRVPDQMALIVSVKAERQRLPVACANLNFQCSGVGHSLQDPSISHSSKGSSFKVSEVNLKATWKRKNDATRVLRFKSMGMRRLMWKQGWTRSAGKENREENREGINCVSRGVVTASCACACGSGPSAPARRIG